MARYLRVRRWSRLHIGTDIVFKGSERRFHFRVEARSPEYDFLKVSMQRPGRKKRETTFLFGVNRWMEEGRILIRKI